MDTNDYSAALEEATLLDSDQNEDISFGKEVAKSLLVSTAASACVFGGTVAIALAAPYVSAWFNRKKNPDTIDGEVLSDILETPQPEKV